MKKLLTIAIPAYNMEEYLDRCLSSLIVNEIFIKYLDVIIVNDGSNDSTLRIAQEYCTKYSELFRVIDKKNGNWGSCINIASQKALGKYFLILDADDWLETKELESFIKMLQNETNVDLLVYTCCFLMRGNKRKKMFQVQLDKNKIYQVSQIKDFPFFIHCLAIKTSIMQQINLLEGISYCDVEINVYMFRYVQTIMITDICLYNYVIGRPGQTVEMNSYIKNLYAIVKIYKRYSEEHSVNENILYWQRKAIYPLLLKYYQANLLYRTSVNDYEIFKEIDKEICKDPLLKRELYKHSIGKVKYIKLWSVLHVRSILRVFGWLIIRLKNIKMLLKD